MIQIPEFGRGRHPYGFEPKTFESRLSNLGTRINLTTAAGCRPKVIHESPMSVFEFRDLELYRRAHYLYRGTESCDNRSYGTKDLTVAKLRKDVTI